MAISSKASNRPALGLIILALSIYGALVAGFSWKLREEIRGQVIGNTAAVLYPVANLRVMQAEEELPADDPEIALNNLLTAVLDTADMSGVVAMRVFKADNTLFESIPESYNQGMPDSALITEMHLLKPHSAFFKNVLPDQFFDLKAGSPVQGREQYLEVTLPLHDADFLLLGYAQLLIDGSPTAANLASVDRNLWLQSGLAFLSGSALLGAAIWWAFRRLQSANQALEERSRRLAEANHELLLSAKTSAIGAISAHLIHGLKNPLAGLSDYVSSRGQQTPDAEEDGVLAVEATRRMQNLIQEVVDVLREEESGDHFDFTLEELAELARNKVGTLARKQQVLLLIDPIPDGHLDSRRGNLVLLILANLLQNAIEASASGSVVEMQIIRTTSALEILVRDRGAGLPEAIRANPFKVNASAKPGGSGLGLAISSQLARHLGGALIVTTSGPEGTTFKLSVPVEL